MFNKLREKLKNWTQGLIKKAVVEEVQETSKKEKARKPAKEKKVSIKKETKEKPIKELKKEIKEEIKPIEEHEFIEPEKKVFDKEERQISEKILEDIKTEEEKKGFFKRIFSSISHIKISKEDFEAYSGDLEMILLENNVAVEVAEKIIKQLKENIVGKEFLKKEIEGQIKESLKDIIYSILIEPFDIIDKIREKKGTAEHKPYVILFCGINGTGKTTTIAKLGNMLKEKKLSCVFAAGDTFRAASIEQLKKHGNKLNIEVIAHEYGSDPASVGFDSIKYAEKNHIDVVLIDTAGRMHTEKNLMAQVEKIAKVCKPDIKLFIGESITGNDIIEQIKIFNESVQIDGIILAKADIDEKGGTALSVGYTTGKPILYLGTGQEYKDLEKFDKNKFVESLGL
jgi:fused signal recognition particle receptor